MEVSPQGLADLTATSTINQEGALGTTRNYLQAYFGERAHYDVTKIQTYKTIDPPDILLS